MSETPSAYSVEEHMFNQDEIQQRHPQPADKQRSEPVTEIVFGPNNLSQSEQEWRAIAAGNRLAEQVMFWHTKDCNVHAPTLKPCSCGLETRMRQLIADQSAIIAERDATIAQLRQGIANLIRDSNAEIAELRAEAAGLRGETATANLRVLDLRDDKEKLREQIATLQTELAEYKRKERDIAPAVSASADLIVAVDKWILKNPS